MNINNKAVPNAENTKIREPSESSASPTSFTFASIGMFASLSQVLILSIFSAVLKPFFVLASTISILSAFFFPIEKILFFGF